MQNFRLIKINIYNLNYIITDYWNEWTNRVIRMDEDLFKTKLDVECPACGWKDQQTIRRMQQGSNDLILEDEEPDYC